MICIPHSLGSSTPHCICTSPPFQTSLDVLSLMTHQKEAESEGRRGYLISFGLRQCVLLPSSHSKCLSRLHLLTCAPFADLPSDSTMGNAPLVCLSNGHKMPLIGLGTWQVHLKQTLNKTLVPNCSPTRRKST